MSEHAKEPWANGLVVIGKDAVTGVLDCNGDEICNMGESLLDEDANACRIVACVNACAGIPNEALERGGLEMPLLSTLADIRTALGVGDKPMLEELAGIVLEIREQADRDEKAACKAMSERDAVAARAEKIRKALVDAKRERDEAVEALRFYANYSNYRYLDRKNLPITLDYGDMARAVLAKIGGQG